jgi:predicted nuclease with TOPRIM domain
LPGFLPDSPFIGPINTQIPLERWVAQLSEQLSSLRINNSNHRVNLDSLFDELKKIKTLFDTLAEDIKDINSMKTLYSDFVQHKLSYYNEVNCIQLAINGIIQSIKNDCIAIQQNLSQLVKLACTPTGTNQEVPEIH